MKKLLTLLTFMLFAVMAQAVTIEHLYVAGGNADWNYEGLAEVPFDEEKQAFIYDASSTGGLYFAFSDKKDCESWDDFNGNHRYAIASGNRNVTLDTPTTLVKIEGTIVVPAGNYTVSVTKELVMTVTGAATPISSWTVAGTPAEVFGTIWDHTNTSNDMVKGEGNTWTFTKENVSLTAGNIEFKVCGNHAWGTSYPGSDYVLPVPEAGIYDVNITFNDDTKAVSATLVEKHEYTAAFKNSVGWASVYAYTYNDETLGGWRGTKMDKDGDVYTISFFAATPPANIIFNDGTGGVVGESQTANLDFVDGKTYDMVSPGYYIVGNMTSWELNKDNKMTKNESADADEYMKIAIPLENGNQFKVVSTEDGSNITTWYPGGETPNYTITEDGTYDIYFRPEEKAGWFGNHIYVAQEISIDITKNLWASYSSTKALDFSNSGLTAYIATTRNGSSVHYEPVTYVPANTGIILNGTQGTHVAVTIPSAEAVGTNLLVSTANAEHEVTAGEVGKVYAFGMMGGKVGFVQAEAGYTVTQGKSYLNLSTVGAKGIDFIGLPGSETDGIDTIHNAQFIMHNDAYNLAGQKVSKDYKGIVIVNGKKYLNK